MKIVSRVCDRCGDPVPAGMKPINFNDKEIDICSPACLGAIVIDEYQRKDNVIFLSTKKLESLKQKEA